jgi:hypothetical protein
MMTLGALAALVLCGGTARADIPRTINFQGRLADASGTPVRTPYLMTFKIFDSGDPGQGTACHTEQTQVGMSSGLFNTALGGAAGINAACDFSKPYWLEIAVDTDAPMSPRIALTSAAYAFTAARLIGKDPATGLDKAYAVSNSVVGAIPYSGGPTGMSTGLNAEFLGGHRWEEVAKVDAVLLPGYGVAAQPYTVAMKRYIIEAPPASVGITIKLDQALMSELCRDKDGCRVTTQMINWDNTGNVASRQWKLFLSETGNKWQVSDVDTAGVDNDGVVTDVYNAWDCYFSDAETYNGTANGRTDSGLGFGVLNIAGGSYSDTTTTCRWVIED